jgi:hypothetical protein
MGYDIDPAACLVPECLQRIRQLGGVGDVASEWIAERDRSNQLGRPARRHEAASQRAQGAGAIAPAGKQQDRPSPGRPG